jgi:hypothetical protein
MTMATKTTPTDIRYEYMHIGMTNIFLYLFAKIISFTLLSSTIIYICSIILLWKARRYVNRLQLVPVMQQNAVEDLDTNFEYLARGNR